MPRVVRGVKKPKAKAKKTKNNAYSEFADILNEFNLNGFNEQTDEDEENDLGENENEENAEVEDIDDENLGLAETYADYKPSKLRIGEKHPDAVVETASLSSVEPTDVWYKLSLPEDTIKSGSLSALQLEAVTYAAQQHEHFLPDGSRAGFLIGDGAGVGKGRTVAGIIFENYLKGRKKAIWVSVSSDLKYDAERDLNDIGASRIEVFPLNKFKYAKITSPANGYVKEGVIFSTYSALIGESTQSGVKCTRLKQLLQWCGDDFDGPIIFDECHRAKNLFPAGPRAKKPTKTGLTVLKLQDLLPKARVVYASATGASEPKNMAYMTRLGIWGRGSAFLEFTDFIKAVEKRGVGAMEIVAMDMKLRGMYIARQLSFHGVTFKIEDVPLDEEFIQMYDDSAKLWADAMEKFELAAELMFGDDEGQAKRTMWAQFWSAHQRFFKYLCIANKVRHCVNVAREAVENGKCVVIGLQSTGEARTLDQLEKEDGELSDFVSTAKGVLQTLVDKHFPAPDRKGIHRLLGKDTKQSKQKNGNLNSKAGCSNGKRKSAAKQSAVQVKKNKVSGLSSESDSEISSEDSDFKVNNSISSDDLSEDDSDFDDLLPTQLDDSNAAPPPTDEVDRACSMKEELLEQIEAIGDRLPPNTLDQLIDELGGPDKVAEMTGRKGRVVHTDTGEIQYESRSEIDIRLETLNLTEKKRFMDGDKDVAIISEAASSGISLQSDRRAKNQRRRVHITLELPWSADRAIQQFGRTHRSNQVNAPEYIFLISDLAGERRFASIVAKRLESLGALTHGDRRATETRDLSRYNIDNKYGRLALKTTMNGIMGYKPAKIPPPEDYEGNFFADISDALASVGLVATEDYNNISKFLNRILGLPVELQNRLFKYFSDTLEAIIADAKKSGRYDLGIRDLGWGSQEVKQMKMYSFSRKHATGVATTELHIVMVERGMSWDAAFEKWSELSGSKEGFYLSYQNQVVRPYSILAVASEKDSVENAAGEGAERKVMYTIYRPNTGLQPKQESLAEIENKNYYKVELAVAEKYWKNHYNAAENTCCHMYWFGNCKTVNYGRHCEHGSRKCVYNVVSGSVLNVWSRVEAVLAKNSVRGPKMQVVRLKTAEGVKIVGALIPNSCVQPLRFALAADAENTSEESYA